MKKIALIIVGLSLFLGAGDFRAVPMEKAQIVQDGKAKMFCNVCGMTLPMFYKTNHAAEVDGKTHQYCSIHCMFEEAMTKGIKVKNPKVVDNDTLKFIPSPDAFYVVGSKQPGTMSTVSKYAFGKKASADAFAKKFGGKVMGYAEVSKIVQNGLVKEIAMIKKRQAKAAKMGEKIYKKMCKQTDERFENAAIAKVFIKEHKLCGKLKGKPFQQVALYLANK
jgi:nitrous oxide reductase accessory protein NosL